MSDEYLIVGEMPDVKQQILPICKLDVRLKGLEIQNVQLEKGLQRGIKDLCRSNPPQQLVVKPLIVPQVPKTKPKPAERVLKSMVFVQQFENKIVANQLKPTEIQYQLELLLGFFQANRKTYLEQCATVELLHKNYL